MLTSSTQLSERTTMALDGSGPDKTRPNAWRDNTMGNSSVVSEWIAAKKKAY